MKYKNYDIFLLADNRWCGHLNDVVSMVSNQKNYYFYRDGSNVNVLSLRKDMFIARESMDN